MARDPHTLNASLRALVQPGARSRLRARGLARSMVWRDGVLPPGGPTFTPELTSDLLHFGYGALAMALELRDANLTLPSDGEPPFETSEGCVLAAECLEAAVRRGPSA